MRHICTEILSPTGSRAESEVRRRGLGRVLLQKALESLRASAKPQQMSFLGGQQKDTALRAVVRSSVA